MNATISNILSYLLIILSIGIQQCNSFSAETSSQRVFVSTPSKSTQRIVSDLMTSSPNLFTLDPHTPVDEAIVTLLQAGVSGAPVVERLKNAETNQIDTRLIGFVSSFDFLPREESGTLVELSGQDEDTETARRILGKDVQDVMTRNPVTVTTNDLMKSTAETMAKHRLHALPVVDAKHGNLVGIITAKDVMRDVIKRPNLGLPSEDTYSQSSIPEDLAA